MIDSEELLVELCGVEKVEAFKDVKSTSMRLARVVKEAIAQDLGGTIPPSGKQFLTTREGTWRLAARANSDNSTEMHAHRRAGAQYVQVFGHLSDYRRAQGWMSIDELYAQHGRRFDPGRLLREVERRLGL